MTPPTSIAPVAPFELDCREKLPKSDSTYFHWSHKIVKT